MLAVTTGFPNDKDFSTKSFAIEVPPINSTIISIDSSKITEFASVVKVPFGISIPLSFDISISAIFDMDILTQSFLKLFFDFYTILQ